MKGTENLIFVTGPVASGKTKNARELCRHFGCTHFLDGLDSVYGYSEFETKCLVITSVSLNDLNKLFPESEVYSFDLAMSMAREQIILTRAEIQQMLELAWSEGLNRNPLDIVNPRMVMASDCNSVLDSYMEMRRNQD